MPLGGPSSLSPTGVTAGSYSAANLTVNVFGQITAAADGAGGGSSYAEVANYAALPAAASYSGVTYLVRAAQGVIFVNRKAAGLYRSDGSAWTRLDDESEAYFQDTLAWSNITSKPSAFDTTAASVASVTHAATGKTTPADADELGLIDSAASNVLKRLTWANLKAALKTYFDTLYDAAGAAAAVTLTTLGGTAPTGTGAVVRATGASLVTPALGVAAATTINKVTLTAPATGSTLTIADGKTATFSATLTLAGTDGSTLNIGAGGTLGTAAYTAASAYVPVNGALGTPTSGTLTNCTFPTLNQSTSGNAGTATALATPRAINGVNFDGTAAVDIPPGPLAAINAQTASYTLVLTDRFKWVTMNNASANNLTVPLNSSVAFPTGTQITVEQLGAGLTTIVATGGVTLRSRGGALKSGGQYAVIVLTKVASDTWNVTGDITT